VEPTCVLVIDDEPRLLQVIESFLSIEGFEVICSQSAEDGLRLVADRTPDIVVIDINMPGMDGLEVCRRIKSHAPGLPVLIFSGRGSWSDGERSRLAGAGDFVEKPFNLRELAALIRSHIAAPHSSARPVPSNGAPVTEPPAAGQPPAASASSQAR
jgi:DNA-binding response OmpR family regulator